MIAYYVHHHGTGHTRRAASVAAQMHTPVVGLSSLGPPVGWTGPWITLSDDASDVRPETADVTARDTFHWLPRHHSGLRQRMAAVSALLADGQIAYLVSDVSVEMTVLARLHGVPVVVMAQPGDRTDRPHQLAYDIADLVLAPWPPSPSRPVPASWAAKTVHLGGFSRYDGRCPPARDSGRQVLVVWGSGGVDVPAADLYAAAAATPQWDWRIAGPPAPWAGSTPPANVTRLGWVEDLWSELCQADVVVTHAGQNAIAEVAAARRPAVVLAQWRPFGEQRATADALRHARLASVISTWPEPSAWSALLRGTVRLGGDRWSGWSSGQGAQRAAREIENLVGNAGP